MKFGKALIVTFHCCPNYGAVLQTFALSEYLKKIFSNVEIVNYQPTSVMKDYRYINTFSLPSIIMSLISLPNFIRKRRRFIHFQRKHLTLSPLYTKRGQINNIDGDYCFLGSDQIWNPLITNGLDPVYFGLFNSNKNMKVISYAASIGNYQALNKERIMFNSFLQNVDHISVREEDAKSFISAQTNKKISVVLDPTLLVGVETFLRFVESNRFKVPYLLIYTLNPSADAEIRPVASKIAETMGLKLVEINGNRNGYKRPNHIVFYDINPEDFVSLFANAEYVVTDSFHGTAFSLLFHKQFITFKHKTRGDRMENLLSKVNLLDRMTNNPNQEQVIAKIDWDEVDDLLKSERKQSEDFINQSLALDSNDKKK